MLKICWFQLPRKCDDSQFFSVLDYFKLSIIWFVGQNKQCEGLRIFLKKTTKVIEKIIFGLIDNGNSHELQHLFLV